LWTGCRRFVTVGWLARRGKDYEFYRYDGAGHGFFYYHAPMYRPEAAMDGWAKVFTFFGQHLAG
jgi:carboxymethylenebutenolidase